MMMMMMTYTWTVIIGQRPFIRRRYAHHADRNNLYPPA